MTLRDDPSAEAFESGAGYRPANRPVVPRSNAVSAPLVLAGNLDDDSTLDDRSEVAVRSAHDRR